MVPTYRGNIYKFPKIYPKKYFPLVGVTYL